MSTPATPQPADLHFSTLTPDQLAELEALAPRRGFRLDRRAGHWRVTWRFDHRDARGRVASSAAVQHGGLALTLLWALRAYAAQVQGRAGRTLRR